MIVDSTRKACVNKKLMLENRYKGMMVFTSEGTYNYET